ncbi:MAG: helicase HerA-like domain-containing protein [Polyangiaceae bacterium]
MKSKRVPTLDLGQWRALDGDAGGPFRLPAHHLVTHGVVLGMTGSGKTGLLTVMIEEALRTGVPVLVIDVKGDMPNLLLSFPTFAPEAVLPWVGASTSPADDRPHLEIATELAEQRRKGLSGWSIDESHLDHFARTTSIRVITPGTTAGELLHVLSSLERRSDRWEHDPESARAALSAAISLVLRLLGLDPDPARSREHVLLSVLAERRLTHGDSASLENLLEDLATPPVTHVGALELDAFLPKRGRKELAAALNTLLASPTFASWRQGTTLDVGAWLTPTEGRTPCTIVSVAHLDDDERTLVLGVLLEEALSWVRGLPGSQRLRALIVFDEVYGFLPPHPANPPTKRPLVALMKQARAFGVGIVVATQNPMDLDYRALGNAGLWCLGRLQTDADRERVVDGLGANGVDADESLERLGDTLRKLGKRWFVVRDAHGSDGTVLMQPRWAMSFMKGPMTRSEIRAALGGGPGANGVSAGVASVPVDRRD